MNSDVIHLYHHGVLLLAWLRLLKNFPNHKNGVPLEHNKREAKLDI